MRRFAVLMIPLVALAGCEFWSKVTVPSSDRTAPNAYTTLYYNGKHQKIGASSGFTTKAPAGNFWIIGSGVDSGGVKRVEVQVEVRKSCRSFGGFSSGSTSSWVPMVATQRGGVGSTVDNGLWTGHYFSGYVGTCNPGYYLVQLDTRWRSVVTDYHGNSTTSAWSMITR